MKHFSLNRVFGLYLLWFTVMVTGIIPRETALPVAFGVLVWLALVPPATGAQFFIRAIPLFTALPFTAGFDNFNLWRLASVVLFIRCAVDLGTATAVLREVRACIASPFGWARRHPTGIMIALLPVLAVLSLISAPHPSVGAMRIVYFMNLSVFPFTLWLLLRADRIATSDIYRSIRVAASVVITAGLIQLLSTYAMDVYQFMRVWGEGIQLRQFGTQWSYIAVWVGNTWLAYYGPQLSLRVFSLFPDSHSFPTFILLALPALLAAGLLPVLQTAGSASWQTLIRTRAALSVLWVPAAFLAAILSGTRGIWAASVGVVILALLWSLFLRFRGADMTRRRMFAYGASYLAVFFLLFALAWPIFTSPQFLIGKSDLGLLKNRIRSVIDFGETSNALRIAIWRASAVSIAEHPLLGVGIGNFPVVLDQDIMLARAGSTAHNLYLHIAAEMGIPAAVIATLVLIASVMAAYRWFLRANGSDLIYAGSLLLYLPWVYAYVMTDPILFDERIFLAWGTVLALVWANDHA